MAEDRLVAGKSPSAEEFEDRVEDLKAQHDHGTSEGKPDPKTEENAPAEGGSEGDYINAPEGGVRGDQG